MIVASIHGRIGGDPVSSETKTGKPMCRVSVAVDVAGFNASEPESLWVSVMAFSRQAETLARCVKGETLSAMGKLSRSHYVGKDGTERESWSLLADAVVTTRSARPPGRKSGARPGGYDAQAPFDDDIGF